MSEVIFKDWYKGVGKSSRDEMKFDEIVGLDIHSTPGLVQASYAMLFEPGSAVGEICTAVAMVESTGDTYWFSATSGKVWKRTYTGSWSLPNTLTSMTTGIRGACAYHGNIFFATASKVGRYNISTNTWYENEFSFTRGQGTLKPMAVENLTLYIGDQDYIASVRWNGSTFDWNPNALDVKYEMNCSSLMAWKGNLVVGTTARTFENKSWIFFWDTYSDSWTYEDYIPESSVNTFIPADNSFYLQAGDSGNVYQCDGVTAIRDKVLRGEATTSANFIGFGGNQAATEYNGQALFHGYKGIWSITNFDNDLPRSISIPYVLSQGQNLGICPIISLGPYLLCAWRDSSGSFGVDKISTITNSYRHNGGYIVTPAITGNFQMVEVKYSDLPSGTSLTIYTKVNDGSWTQQTSIVDTIRRVVYFDGGLGDVTTLQAKIIFNTSETSTPVVESIKFL
jgi:hypothetical protein